MEHRFRTHLSPPPAVMRGSREATSAALGELQRRPASVTGDVRVAPAGCGASRGAACGVSLSIPERPRKSTYLECSICGLIPKADHTAMQSLKAVLKENCARSSYCCFVDRRLTRPRGDIRDTSSPVTNADCALDDAKNRMASSAQTLVARVYSTPVELSQACLLRSTTALEVSGSVQSREARMAAAPGRISPEEKELYFSIHDPGPLNAAGAAPSTAGRADTSEDRKAYSRRTTPIAAISRSMDVVLADESVATSSAMNFLQLVDVTEYQSECWKGDVFEFDMCGDSALPYCVFVCNVYSDISGTREAFPECTQVCVAARLPVDTMNASEVAESQCFLMTRLEQLREAFHPYVALRSRHYLPVAAAVGVPATSQTV